MDNINNNLISKFNATVNCLSTLEGYEFPMQLEILANVMMALSLDILSEEEDSFPKNWDECYLYIASKKKEQGESMALALGQQALTFNVWIQEYINGKK